MNDKALRRIIFVIMMMLLLAVVALGCTNVESILVDDGSASAPSLSFTSDTDTGLFRSAADILDVAVGGASDFQFKANLFELQPGSVLDLNGAKLDLDADADTSLTADTDDQIDIEIAGADDFVFSANLFESQSGSVVDLNGTKLELDADADTSITADTDDQVDFEIGGSDELSLTASTFDYNDTTIDQDLGTENIGSLPTIVSQTITYTAAAGGTGTVLTVTDGEIWLVHGVYANVTTNFDATGDDALVEIGDGNDADGLLDLDDGELQTTDTEGTGAPAGWQGFMSTDSRGAYLANGQGFIYAPSGADETIDYNIDETSGETLAAGELTLYVVYTRLQ